MTMISGGNTPEPQQYVPSDGSTDEQVGAGIPAATGDTTARDQHVMDALAAEARRRGEQLRQRMDEVQDVPSTFVAMDQATLDALSLPTNFVIPTDTAFRTVPADVFEASKYGYVWALQHPGGEWCFLREQSRQHVNTPMRWGPQNEDGTPTLEVCPFMHTVERMTIFRIAAVKEWFSAVRFSRVQTQTTAPCALNTSDMVGYYPVLPVKVWERLLGELTVMRQKTKDQQDEQARNVREALERDDLTAYQPNPAPQATQQAERPAERPSPTRDVDFHARYVGCGSEVTHETHSWAFIDRFGKARNLVCDGRAIVPSGSGPNNWDVVHGWCGADRPHVGHYYRRCTTCHIMPHMPGHIRHDLVEQSWPCEGWHEGDPATLDELKRMTRPQQDHQLLTRDEHKAMELTAELMRLFKSICGKEASRSQDIAEIEHHVHALQNTILAQAAARAYPQQYRLLGETLMKDDHRG